jgi:GntR family transcriptional repressor for pyruvate dehydrogenase complex
MERSAASDGSPADGPSAPAGEEAVAVLTEMIRSRQLRPGDRLPTERQLAETMGLSRNTVREAIRALEMIRVLDVRRGDGTYVTSLEPDVLLQATTFVVQLLQDHSVIEMLEVRAILEAAAAETAAARISKDHLRELERAIPELDHEPWSDRWLEADRKFHTLIAKAAGNGLLESLLETLSTGTYTARHVQGDVRRDENVRLGESQHRRIYEAIARRDPRAAGLEAGAHVSATAAWLRAVLEGAATAHE